MASNTFPGTRPKRTKVELSDSKEWDALEAEALQESLSEAQKAIVQKAKEIDKLRGQLNELKSSFGPMGKLKESPISSDTDSGEESPSASPTVKFPTHSTPAAPSRKGKARPCKVRREVVPEKYDGRKSWENYIIHFEACKKVNGWADQEACAWLAASLTGDAVVALGQNFVAETCKYSDMKKRLEDHFGPSVGTDQYALQFRNRKRQAGETLQELAQVLRRLVCRAYPRMSAASRGQLAMEQFKEAVDVELRGAIFRAKPANLEEAVNTAIEMECYLKSEKARGKSGLVRMAEVDVPEATTRDQRIDKMETQMAEMLKLLQGMQALVCKQETTNQQGSRKPKTCFYCNQAGHFKMDCPKFQEDNPEGYKEYLEKRSGNGPRPNQGPKGRP